MTFFDTKFFQIIKTFSPTELKDFEYWLKSPWANSNKNLIRLLEKVKKYHPNFDNKKLTKEKLFKQILPNGKFSDRRMNNLMSEGFLAAERFLVFHNLSQNENLQKDLLTQELQNRHLEDWFFRDANEEIARLEAKPIKDWEDHLDLLRLHRRIYHHPNQNPRMQPGGQTIVQMGKQLDLVFLLEKAAIITEIIFRNRIRKNENYNIEKELSIWQTASKAIEHPAVEFYKMRFAYREETMLEQYFKLRKAISERYTELNEKEQKIHLISLLNDTILLIRRKLIDITESLPVYKLGLQTGILIDRNKLQHNAYVAIVSASNYKGDFNFTKIFIESYTNKLDEPIQSDGYNWAKANMAYYKENHVECLDILLNHDFKVIYFKLITRILNVQVYFDLYLKDDSFQLYLFNYLDSFEKWLIREKFRSELLKKSYLRFVQISRALAKYYSEKDISLKKIEGLLENENNIQAVNWLEKQIKKIIELKK